MYENSGITARSQFELPSAQCAQILKMFLFQAFFKQDVKLTSFSNLIHFLEKDVTPRTTPPPTTTTKYTLYLE